VNGSSRKKLGGFMAKLNLFEYCVIYHPKETKKQEEDGIILKSELIRGITQILAKDDKEVAILAAREIPEKYIESLDRVEIKIRPF
jgi:hypothetical protein